MRIQNFYRRRDGQKQFLGNQKYSRFSNRPYTDALQHLPPRNYPVKETLSVPRFRIPCHVFYSYLSLVMIFAATYILFIFVYIYILFQFCTSQIQHILSPKYHLININFSGNRMFQGSFYQIKLKSIKKVISKYGLTYNSGFDHFSLPKIAFGHLRQ